MNRTDAIKHFLQNNTHIDLANLYSLNMECQVNVAQDDGEQINGEYNGKKWLGYTDHFQTWKSFRIPYKANSTPEYIDTEMKFDLALHAEGIGMTGWDWQNRVSRWVAYDFDGIMGHSDKHANKLTVDELAKVQEATCNIEWVTTRLSTSGNGLHLYVFLPNVPTENHTEHAALGRSILHLMSAKAGYDFVNKVDICGGNMWVWHRKMKGTNGLKIIKSGIQLDEIPPNWREHVKVTTGTRRCVLPDFISEDKEDKFLELTGRQTRVKLDTNHQELIKFLEKSGASFWWDNDHHMLVCHTFDLKQAHDELHLRGIFDTVSTGSSQGIDHNCFAFPQRKGVWVVRRYGEGTSEKPTWQRDAGGYTYCYINKEPDLRTLAAAHGGIEHQTGGYVFKHADEATQAAIALGIDLGIPDKMGWRETKLKINKDGKLIVEMPSDQGDQLSGWLSNKGKWTKVFHAPKSLVMDEIDVGDFDDIVRHVVSPDGSNSGWVVRSESQWTDEPLAHVSIALRSMNLKDNEVKGILGSNVFKPWPLTNLPFQEEYPGDRRWNRDAAQFRYAPDLRKDPLEYPYWRSILQHVGASLDEPIKRNQWCMANGILTGEDYLKCWIAAMFQYPFEPLPYLFLYGDQRTGKSILHEGLSLLMTRGYKRADQALKSASGFNGELEKAILCVVEEVDLRDNKAAYNYIKDFVTAIQISIHIKGKTPFMAQNTTHWMQLSNEREACPVFDNDDSRIQMIRVGQLKEGQEVAKRVLLNHLKKEAPDFLASVLKLEIPECNDRLRLPLIETEDKVQAIGKSKNLLVQFIDEECYYKAGHKISVADFHTRFQGWLDPNERYHWSKHKISRSLPDKFIRGRDRATAQWYYGNISFDVNAKELTPFHLEGDKLTL